MKNHTTEKAATPPIMDYDVNLTFNGRIASQTVTLVFGQWTYRAAHTLHVKGNITGLDVISSALKQLYESLEYTEHKGKQYARITMESPNGEETLECSDDDYRQEDWLAEMLIRAEITSIA